MKPRTELLVISIAMLSAVCAQAGDWPFVRGNELATGTTQEKMPEQIDVIWKHTLADSGYEATAVIVSGIVYVGDVDGTFYAYRLDDGSEVWKQTFKESGFLAGAAFHDGRLYVGDFNGVVRGLDATNGHELWKYEAKGEIYAAPNVVEGRVLVTTEAGELISLAADTGELQWQFQIEAPLRCWPTVVNGRVLLAGCDERLHAIDVATGEEVNGVDIDGPTGSTPAMFERKALFGTEQGSFYAIESDEMKIAWRFQDPESVDAIHTAAAVDSRAAIYGTQGKTVYALNPADGKIAWRFAVRSHVESSPVIAGNSAFLATKRGMIHRVDLDTGEELWNYEAGGDFQASFAIADGKLVIGNTDGTLYCFGAK